MEMQDLRIRATLDCNPGIQHEQKMLKITKGADAYLTYNLSKKCYMPDQAIDKIEQITFIFKYNKYFVAYDMFDGELIDEHFSSYEDLAGNTYVLFHFSSDDTKELPVTDIDDGLLFEVVIKFDTDSGGYLTSDSTIIEDQQPILVVDSLYSQFK